MLNNILWTTKILHIIQYSNVNHINVQYTTQKKDKVYTCIHLGALFCEVSYPIILFIF
jgi:hypothetical protein